MLENTAPHHVLLFEESIWATYLKILHGGAQAGLGTRLYEEFSSASFPTI